MAKGFWIGTGFQSNTTITFKIPKVSLPDVKAVALQAWTGLEGSRKLRFPDFVITAQDIGKVVSLTHRPPLPPGNTPVRG